MKDYRKYQDYISLKDVDTKSFLMISELIDNAIGSFDDNYGENNWKEKLVVDVVFYFDKNSTPKIINGVKTQEKSYIKVVDNAFGMSKDKLFDVISLNQKNLSTTSKMHRHGRGLKQCSFYFGADLEIETWNEKNEISGIQLNTSQFGPYDDVDFESYKVEEGKLKDISKRGTSIKISKIYSNKTLTQSLVKDKDGKIISEDGTFNKLKEAISYRYIKLISSENMELRYCENIYEENSELIPYAENNEPIQTVYKKFGYFDSANKKRDNVKIERKISESIEEVEKGIKGKINQDGVRNFPKHPELIREVCEKISDLIRTEDSEKEFKWSQIIDVNGKELPVSFWMLKDKHSAFKGYRVYEGNRALMHPPMTDDGGTSTYHRQVFPRSFKTGSTDNVFAGEFDILDINASTSTDKSKFIFADLEDEIILNEKLRIVWEVFNIFVKKGRNDTETLEGKNIKKDDITEIESTIKTKFSSIASDIEVTDKEVMMNLKIDKENTWQLNIIIDSESNPKKIWDKKVSIARNRKIMNITAYTGHPIWKRIDDSVDFLSEALVPITIFIAHYEISNIIDGTKNDGISIDNINKIKSPIDMLNESAKIVEE